MNTDILEIKPGWGPIKVNLNEVFRRWQAGRKPTVETVATRFLQLHQAHGVATTQIPRFEPGLSLPALRTHETLLTALTPELLERTAFRFGIQRAWLEGVTDRLYRTWHCYKNSAAFFERLHALPFKQGDFQVRALTSAAKLDRRGGATQAIALVFVEKIAAVEDVGETWDIDRYHICGDGWDWAHYPCRIQLKALVRVVDQMGHQPVPLFRVSSVELEAVREGRMTPRSLVNRCLLSEPSLEDYSCSRQEHAQAKETEELPAVFEYVERAGLARMWAQTPCAAEDSDESQPTIVAAPLPSAAK